MNLKNKKLIFWHDYLGDHIEELEAIVLDLQNLDFQIEKDDIQTTEFPPINEKFHILFFDYGGVNVGNSLLDSYCRNIFEWAKEYPNRDFIMTSSFTQEAMSDVLRENNEQLTNIFFNIDEWYQYRNNEFK